MWVEFQDKMRPFRVFSVQDIKNAISIHESDEPGPLAGKRIYFEIAQSLVCV